jgi:Flp pilus assembly pilin Flp
MTELAQLLAARSHALAVTARHRFAELRHDERGSTTIEQVLWGIAAIGFVAIVVAVINGYLTSQAAKIH